MSNDYDLFVLQKKSRKKVREDPGLRYEKLRALSLT